MDFLPIKEAVFAIRQNKARSILAGFGVAWGIFILILLLGAGKGFQEGVIKMFNDYSQNSLWVYGGQVNAPNSNEPISVLFNTEDIEVSKKKFTSIEYSSPELSNFQNSLILYESNITRSPVKGVLSDYFKVKKIQLDSGRLINPLDNNNYKRVAIIGQQVANVLFEGQSPLYKYISIDGVFYKIIGIIKKGGFLSHNDQNLIYIPLNSFVDCFQRERVFNTFILTLSKGTNSINFETEIREFFARRKGFAISDKKAMFILNFDTQVKLFDSLFKTINIFLWMFGLCLLLSGVIGISNIMLVIVKERTFEIGIRKSIGATPKAILWMIITESIIITTFSGGVGFILGLIGIGLTNITMRLSSDSNTLFTHASIDFPIIFMSLLVLIISGILAGFIPAKKAALITPMTSIKNSSR